MSGKAKFGSKIGLVVATVGSAVGLGNVWRFPSEVQSNGGAAFLLVYIACVFLLGIPVMLAEFSLGRGGNSDAVGAFKNLTPTKKWWLVGVLGVIASYLILSFYMVVAGWTLEYFWQSLTGNLFVGINENSNGTMDSAFVARMNDMIASSWNPLIWTSIMIVLNLIVLLKGVQKGIEKMSNILMPLLFVLLIIFCGISLSLPNAKEGIDFFLNPDFSKINSDMLISALGQAFFSLSLGMGILITYSAYYPHDTKLGRTAITVSMLDFFVAFIMGLIIFPAVKTFGLDADPAGLKGVTLVFVTLPEVFMQMPGSQIWSTLFFLLLSVAAITSTISLSEVSISLMQDRFKMSRRGACFLVILPLFVFSAVCSLSQGPLSFIRIGGLNIFDFLDTFATNILLPISSILLCIYVGWILPHDFMKQELNNHGTMKSYSFPIVLFIVRFLAPILIGAILVYKLIEILG
ncbi:MAG: sodium-dependent transporter [Muribaculaceae bacterium]